MKNTENNQPQVVVKKKRRINIPQAPATNNEKLAIITEEKRTQLSLTSVKQSRPKTPSSQRPLHEIFAIFEAAFPKTLGKAFHPLKIGIHKDLAQSVVREQLNHRECRRGLYARMHSIHYLKVCQTGAQRLDLEGKPCGEVTTEQAHYASEQLAKRNVQKDA
ncbi:ProQ/FINO family protein [Zooshikella ganghwensis]|uniref:ProQ/FINO family protein n=1 Tax=Zooshikella ganghwensis TaxID=202772 RepID=UPI0004041A5A|nr:ProQ/FinO family protein [Zooshikella ganghwensis]